MPYFSHPPMEPTHFVEEKPSGVLLCQRPPGQRNATVPDRASLHPGLDCYEDGLPEVALARLPPEYIVSRKGRWAEAGGQTGTAKKKIKIITVLIDQLCSRGD